MNVHKYSVLSNLILHPHDICHIPKYLTFGGCCASVTLLHTCWGPPNLCSWYVHISEHRTRLVSWKGMVSTDCVKKFDVIYHASSPCCSKLLDVVIPWGQGLQVQRMPPSMGKGTGRLVGWALARPISCRWMSSFHSFLCACHILNAWIVIYPFRESNNDIKYINLFFSNLLNVLYLVKTEPASKKKSSDLNLPLFPWIPFSKHDRCASDPTRRSPSRPQGPQIFGGICWLGVSDGYLVYRLFTPRVLNHSTRVLKGFLYPR